MWVKILIPFIGAFIGWLTNVIAIKLLFHPYKPILGIQGVLPKYRKEAAERLGAVVKEHFINNESLINSLREEDIKKAITPLIKKLKNPVITEVLKNLLNPLTIVLKDYLSKALKETPNIIQVDRIVADKVKSFDFKELEKVVYQASGPELRFIKLSGAILGFIIGGIQVIIVSLLMTH